MKKGIQTIEDLAKLVAHHVVAETGTHSPYYDQDNAPVRKRKFLALVAKGAFPNARKVGKQWLVPKADFDKWLAENGRRPDAGDDKAEPITDAEAEERKALGLDTPKRKAS